MLKELISQKKKKSITLQYICMGTEPDYGKFSAISTLAKMCELVILLKNVYIFFFLRYDTEK